MNFQQLIDQRKFLDFSQEQELMKIFSHKLVKDKREKIKNLLKTKFYTIFDGHRFATRFYIYAGSVEHGLSETELREFRKELLEL